MAREPKDKPAPASEPKPKRKPVDKLPAGYVRVKLETVVLSDAEANALYFAQTGSDSPEDRLEVAAVAREAVRLIVKEALVAPLARAVARLIKHEHDAAVAAAEKRAQEAAAELEQLKAAAPPSPLAAEPAGGTDGRKSIGGTDRTDGAGG